MTCLQLSLIYFLKSCFHRDATNKEAQPNNTSPQATSQAGAKHVSFASAAATPSGSVMPDLKECMNEIGFNTVLAKKKKKVKIFVGVLGCFCLFVCLFDCLDDLPIKGTKTPTRGYKHRASHNQSLSYKHIASMIVNCTNQ